MADIIFPGEVASNLGQRLPGNLDLKIYRGDTFRFKVVLNNKNGERLDISDHTIKAQMRSDFDSEFAIDLDCVFINGEMLITLSSYESSKLEDKSYIWDLQIAGPLGVRTIVAGDVSVIMDVTRNV